MQLYFDVLRNILMLSLDFEYYDSIIRLEIKTKYWDEQGIGKLDQLYPQGLVYKIFAN